jgi:hypothetical protein
VGLLCTPSLHERICSRASARQDACKETGQAAICTGWADWPPAYPRRLTVNFQVTVLKVLSRRLCKPVGPRARRGHPCHRGRSAPPCWRHACPSSKSSEKGVVERRDGGWQITEKGRSVLARMEARSEGASCCAGFADGTARSLGRHGSRPPSSSVAKAPPSL